LTGAVAVAADFSLGITEKSGLISPEFAGRACHFESMTGREQRIAGGEDSSLRGQMSIPHV